MKVSDFMTAAKKAQVASPNTSLLHIAKQLMENKCSCVVVVEDDKPVGILTKTDITRAFAEGASPDTLAVNWTSPGRLISVRQDTQTDDIADLIQREFVHHIVVVNSDGKLAGIASSWDVAREVSLDAKAFPYNRELWTKKAETPVMQ